MADLKKEILKKLDRFQYSRGRREVFLDAVEHMGRFILYVADGYAFTAQRYTPKARRLFR